MPVNKFVIKLLILLEKRLHKLFVEKKCCFEMMGKNVKTKQEKRILMFPVKPNFNLFKLKLTEVRLLYGYLGVWHTSNGRSNTTR